MTELCNTMTNYEFRCWWIYYKEKPFGDSFLDYRGALTTKCLLAPWSKSDLPLKQFLLFPDQEEQEELTIEELTAKTQALLGTRRGHLKEDK